MTSRRSFLTTSLAAGAALLPRLATAAEVADYTRTSTGLLPVDYTQSAAITALANLAGDRVVPRLANGTPVGWGQGGRIVILLAGMSNANQEFAKVPSLLVPLLRGALVSTGGVKRMPPELLFLNVARSGQAVVQWGDPTGALSWVRTATLMAQAGVTPAQVQVFGCVYGGQHYVGGQLATMTAAQVIAVLGIARSKFINLQLAPMYDLGYTGYCRNVDALGQPIGDGEPVGHPRWSDVVANGHLLAALAESQAGIPTGVVATYRPMAADGIVRNLRTASPTYPHGINYPPSAIALDGIHITSAGGYMCATNIAERFALDASNRRWLPSTPWLASH